MIKGIIFDMDGVISDTQKLHSKVESELLARFGIKLTPTQITAKYAGVKTEEFFVELLNKQRKKYDLNLIMQEKWEKMEFEVSQSLKAIPGSIILIRKLSKSYKLAVASASNLNYVQMVLKKLKVLDYFSAIVSGDMVKKGKPDPESFLLATSKINIPAKQCLVIEDGKSGMQAAKKAKMKCIGLVSKKNLKYPTDNLVKSLSEINQNYIEKITKTQ